MTETYTITVQLPGLKEEIQESMLDEIDIAKGKWKIYLSEEEKNRVIEKSVEQLIYKVASITKDLSWTPSSEQVKVTPVRDEKNSKLSRNIVLPRDSEYDIRLLEVNDGWKVDKDQSIEAVPLYKFRNRVRERILEWARTAVFYGVGSYKELK